MNHETYDVIVLGTGIAGLFTALKLDKSYRILLLTKDEVQVNNTNLAQGGIAVTIGNTSLESHKDDTIRAGNYFNKPDIVEEVIIKGSQFLDDLLEIGVNFDKDAYGNLLLTREGGHSERRILHSKDSTGKEMVRALSLAAVKQKNIELREFNLAVDILTVENKAVGVSTANCDGIKNIYAKKIVLATGGIGCIYKNTTNEVISTGDGLAMAHRVGAAINDMEFVQFHPTALNIEGERNFLISEAVRGEGGILRNSWNEAFMAEYHELEDLAPRNVVSLAIHHEIVHKGSDGVYLDVSHLDHKYVKERFPMIYNFCLSKGIDINKDLIPVTPVQHYIMGGIVTNRLGQTTVDNLFACGEVANTGMHGANRMASNSLLEGLAFAGVIADEISNNMKTQRFDSQKISYNHKKLCTCPVDMLIVSEDKVKLKTLMSQKVGMIRNKAGLQQALNQIKGMESRYKSGIIPFNDVYSYSDIKEYYELVNMICAAKLVTISALNRPISIGGHVMEEES